MHPAEPRLEQRAGRRQHEIRHPHARGQQGEDVPGHAFVMKLEQRREKGYWSLAKVQEQVEEVATATELLDLVKMSDSTGQLLMLENRIMALRTEG